MNKTLFLSVFAILLLTISVYATPSFNILETSANVSASSGSAISSFTLNNTGTTNLDINFTGLVLTNDVHKVYITTLSNITNISNGSSTSKSFTVTIPTGQHAGLYSGTLTATANGSISDPITINANVTPSYSVSTTATTDLGSVGFNTTYTRTFTINNTGNSNISSMVFSFSDSDFNFSANKSSFVLPYNGSEVVRYSVTTPASFSTGNVTLGTVKMTSSELTQNLFTLTSSISGGLIIEDLDIFLNTRESESESDLEVTDGRKLDFGEEDVGPGSELRFNFNIENTFADSDNIDIDDVVITITIEDIDDGDDLDEESSEFDVESGKTEDVDVYFDLPLSIDEGKYDINILVEGEDDDGNDHSDEINIEMTVKKEGRDVAVSRASIFPESIVCSGEATITATIKNFGTREEERAKLEIINEELGINFVEADLLLEEDPFDDDNEFTAIVPVKVERGTKAKNYDIKVNSYIQSGILWDSETLNLIVNSCSGEKSQEEEKEETVQDKTTEDKKTETTETGTTIPVLKPETSTESSGKVGLWTLFILFNIALIAGLFHYLPKYLKK